MPTNRTASTRHGESKSPHDRTDRQVRVVTPVVLLLVSLALVAACGLFVAAEFSFVTVDRPTVERAAAGGDEGARGVQLALRSLSTQLSGAQVGITVTNLAVGFLADRLAKLGVEDELVKAGAVAGSTVVIGSGTRPRSITCG